VIERPSQPGGNILSCPFCGEPLDELGEIDTSFGSSFTGGKCGCGAVFAFDQSGHGLGEAYVDALMYACNNDSDLAWSLVPGEDYEVVEFSLDSRRKKFSSVRRGSKSTYLFIRIKDAPERAKSGGKDADAPG
jgi:hypothetical protein